MKYEVSAGLKIAALAAEMNEVHSLRPQRDIALLVSDAMERIGNETYGLCGECGERIAPKRLAALPWAKYCTSCQDARDSCAAEVHWNSAA